MSPHPLRRLVIASPWGRVATVCAALLNLPAQGPAPLQGQVPGMASAVQGQVLEHETGTPLAGAAVSLASGPGGTGGIGTRVTNSDGRFLFRQVPPGTYRVVVTLIGYGELKDTLQVGLESDLDLILPMSVSPIRLEPLVVVSERRDFEIMGDFEGRRRASSGTFFDRDEIETRQPTFFTDLLRMSPGVRVVPTYPFGNTVRLRGGCRPELWVDGMRLITDEGMDEILPVMDLEAVEIYHGASLPVEFGSSPCGAIVVWTRRGTPSAGDGSFWRRFAFATGFAFLAFILTR